MRRTSIAGVFAVLLMFFSFLPTGCRSAYVASTVTNNSGSPVTLIEVEYPSASFGVGSLTAGSRFPYRFKVQGSGEIKIQFNDAIGKQHTATGPELQEGQQGTLTISIGPDYEVSWQPSLTKME